MEKVSITLHFLSEHEACIARVVLSPGVPGARQKGDTICQVS
jgi:hypothetical protein